MNLNQLDVAINDIASKDRAEGNRLGKKLMTIIDKMDALEADIKSYR